MRWMELFPPGQPGEELRTFIGLVTNRPVKEYLLAPPPEAVVDLTVETKCLGIQNPIRDVIGRHNFALEAMEAVVRGAFHEAEVFLALSSERDEEAVCGGACCRQWEESSLQRTFLIRFGGTPVGDFVSYGWWSSGPQLCETDWLGVVRPVSMRVVFPEIAVLRAAVGRDGHAHFGHVQLRSTASAFKQVLNNLLEKREEQLRESGQLAAAAALGRMMS